MADRRRPPDAQRADPAPPADPQGEGASSGGGTPVDREDPALSIEVARRELAEEAWRESEERYRHLVENSEDLICTHDPEGLILSANPTMARVTGYSRAELTGRPLSDFLAEESRRELPAYLETIAREGQAHGFMKIRTRAGQVRVLQYDNLAGSEGGRTVVRGIAHDVQRRWAEHALRTSVSRLEALLNNVPDLAWMKDARGRYIAANDAFARFFGLSRREVAGKTDSDLVPPEMAEKFRAEDRRVMERGTSLRAADELPGPGGAPVVFDTIKTPILGDNGRPCGTVGIARDVTERRHLQEQLVQSQKMEAIGRLAGGIAHDFNNLLTTILGYSGLVLDQLGQKDSLRPEIEEIRKAGERAATLTQQLLAFSRKQVIEPASLDLNAIVSEAGKMLRRLIGEDVELVTTLQPGLGSIRADRGQIDQILINLAVNARDAMPEGGRLAIETRDAQDYVPYRSAAGAAGSGPYVLLSVTDTGSGIDAETRRRIFEPFYTTKERGKGTGLGLATVYGIVKQSGGDVWVESEPGRGTTFKVYLPRSDAPAEQPASSSRPSPARGSETLLLVEDEEALRRLVSRVLESIGYEVLAAADAREAREIWERHGARVRLLITDVIMPGSSGPQLAESLTRERPGLKVLYISGYTDSAIVDRGVLHPGTAFLQKPFAPDALARKIRLVLDGIEPPSEGDLRRQGG